MPVIRTIRSHKYQIVAESILELKVIDKSNGSYLSFTKVENKTEEELNAMYPEIPVLKFKKNGYYFLDLKINTSSMSVEVVRSKEIDLIELEISGVLEKYRDGKLSKADKILVEGLKKQKEETPLYIGKISHTNLMKPVAEAPLNARNINDALAEVGIIRDLLPKEFQADIYGKKLRKSKVIKDGKNIKI